MMPSAKSTIIVRIEDLPLGAFARWQILLVYLGLKPACLIEIKSNYYRFGQTPNTINANDLKQIELVLIDSGMSFVIGDVSESECGESHGLKRLVKSRLIYVAQDLARLNKVMEAHHAQPINHHQLGIELGYPPTAVEAFVNRQMIMRSEITDEEEQMLSRFAGFRLSGNYREELKIVRQWLIATQQASPIISKDLWQCIYGKNERHIWK